MSLATNLSDFATRAGTEFKTLRASIGANASLTTTHKATVVGAINELEAAIDALASAEGGATINDGSPSASQVWSSSKTSTEIAAAVSALVDAAPNTLDTLNEIATALGDDPDFASTMTAALGNRVRVDAPQSLTGPQQAQARTNIGASSLAIGTTSGTAQDAALIGDPDQNLVAVFEGALA